MTEINKGQSVTAEVPLLGQDALLTLEGERCGLNKASRLSGLVMWVVAAASDKMVDMAVCCCTSGDGIRVAQAV